MQSSPKVGDPDQKLTSLFELKAIYLEQGAERERENQKRIFLKMNLRDSSTGQTITHTY